MVAALAAIIAFVTYQRRNSYVPSEKKMAQVLADIYLADAIVQTNGTAYNSAARVSKVVEKTYHTILERYGMTKVQFDSAIAWYSANPAEYSKVYDRLIGILSTKEGEFGILLNKRDSINNLITHINDSLRVNYWKGRRILHMPVEDRDSINQKHLTFVYDLDSIRYGTMTVSMGCNFTRKNDFEPNLTSKIIIMYDGGGSDTVSTDIVYANVKKTYELKHSFVDTLVATKMKVAVIESPEFSNLKGIVTDLKIAYMPYQITDSVEFDEISIPPLFSY